MSNPKDRIINHMNKDHQLALVDYVVVYGNEPISGVDADSVFISDVSEDFLALSYSKGDGNSSELKLAWDDVPENENVKVSKMGDIKGKLVAMAKYAAGKQGYSHRKVNKLVLPTKASLYLMYAFACAVSLTLYDKTLIRRTLLKYGVLAGILAKSPGFLADTYSIFEQNVRTIAATVYGIHIIEIATMSWPMTAKYRMSCLVRLGWAFMNFIEGFLVLRRLSKTVGDD